MQQPHAMALLELAHRMTETDAVTPSCADAARKLK
jgi:hypothetical protein